MTRVGTPVSSTTYGSPDLEMVAAPKPRYGIYSHLMPIQLNHTIAGSRDAVAGASFLTELLGLPEATRFGPFQVVEVSNDVSIDFMNFAVDTEIPSLHYAFLVTEEEFDQIWGRITERGLDFWADPHGQRKGEINHNDGGRGLYWHHPDGHWLEIITRPYGSGG